MSSKPIVWLLGDSIRMSYQPHVAKLLQGEAQVVGPADNCQFSLYTLSSLARWHAELGDPVLVHWNNGLHDVGHNPGRHPVQVPLDNYVANLGFILNRLQDMGPTVIWATTTPVHPSKLFSGDTWLWRNEEIDRYNEVALKLMKQHQLAINDLHAIVAAAPDQYMAEDQVHLSEAGQHRCAEAVAEHVRQLLAG